MTKVNYLVTIAHAEGRVLNDEQLEFGLISFDSLIDSHHTRLSGNSSQWKRKYRLFAWLDGPACASRVLISPGPPKASCSIDATST